MYIFQIIKKKETTITIFDTVSIKRLIGSIDIFYILTSVFLVCIAVSIHQRAFDSSP